MSENFNNLLLLKGFNNYFNRTIKVLSALSDYQTSSNSYITLSNINFNPNDGVESTQILNIDEECAKSDYLVVFSGTSTIVSRWFIIECARLRNGQYELKLRRDVIADNYNELKESPFYCEKANLDPDNPLIFNSEGIAFNQIKKKETLLKDSTGIAWIVGYFAQNTEEDIEVDGSFSVIGQGDDALSPSELPAIFPTIGTSGYFYAGIQTAKLKIIFQSSQAFYHSFEFEKEATSSKFYFNKHTTPISIPLENLFYYDDFYSERNFLGNKVANYINAANTKPILDYLALSAHPDNTDTSLTFLELVNSFNNKVVKQDDKYYRIKVGFAGYDNLTSKLPFNSNLTPIYDFTLNLLNNLVNIEHVTVNENELRGKNIYEFNYDIEKILVTYQEISITEVNATVQALRNHTSDQPYDMFCIPYGQINIDSNVCNPTLGLALARGITPASNGGYLYDLQLLPYCPSETIRSMIENNGKINTTLLDSKDYSLIKDSNNNVKSIMLWCSKSDGSFNIPVDISIDREFTEDDVLVEKRTTIRGTTSVTIDRPFDASTNVGSITINNVVPELTTIKEVRLLNLPAQFIATNITFTQSGTTIYIHFNTSNNTGFYTNITYSLVLIIEGYEHIIEYTHTLAEDTKISNECDFCRLVSPNFNGNFEFNVAKAGGSISYIKVDYSYKPYQPYIHLVPNLRGIYGENFDVFNDARGLICGGDFSLSQVSNAFESYEIQNKNYENIFNREIQNMDVNNSINIGKNVFNTITSTTKGVIGGLIAGSPLAAVGGAASGIISSAGNLALGQKQFRENRDFAIDKYNYNLDNIRALPESLSKVSAYNPNNKIFPIIEEYSCTDEEKDALRYKIRYDSMTVMRMGLFKDFIKDDSFIKGRLVRMDSLKDDFHMLDTIYLELLKGVYL